MGRHQLDLVKTKNEAVAELAAHGFSETEIVKVAGERFFRRAKRAVGDELESGAIQANLKVAKSLFAMATSGKSATATIFWLRCRAKWSVKPDDGIDDREVELVFGPYPEDNE